MAFAPVSDLGPVTPLPVARVRHPSMAGLVTGIMPSKSRAWSSGTFLERPELVEQLRAANEPLVVVSGPAGYGKTTLVRQWAAKDERPFAWVDLTAEDNDPNVLAEHLEQALLIAGVLGAGQVKPSVTLARPGGGTPQIDLAAAMSVSAPVVIVLDDAQELVGRTSPAMLVTLLDRMTAGSRLVIAGRSKPPMRWAHLRAENKVREIGFEHLALQPHESVRLLETSGLHLTAKSATSLIDWSEGWPAGLTLAAKALRKRDDPESAARHFDGSDRAVADYLAEALDGYEQQTIDFLLETSVLEHFNAALCDAVRQRKDSSRIIAALEKANLFLVPLDHSGNWYRYHRLFASFLQSERRRQVMDDALLHTRASNWWEQHGDCDRAVRHAFAAGDLERFESLAWSATPFHINSHHIRQLAAWLALPSAEQLIRRPAIALAKAWLTVVLNSGPIGPLTAHLADNPDAVLPDGTPINVALRLLSAAGPEHGPTRALADATEAFDALEGHNPWKALACLYAGQALRLLGQPRQAEARLLEGHNRASMTMPALAASCLVQVAWLRLDEQDWEEAESLVGRARAAFEPAAGSHPVEQFTIDATSALLLAQSGSAAASHCYARSALNALARTGGASATTITAQVVLARALVLLSDHATARQVLYEARAQATRLPEAGILAQRAGEVESIVATAFAASPIPDPLSPAEMRVLRYLPTYMTFEEIGRELLVSRTTVKTQAIAAYRKLGVKSRAQAVKKARQQGLLSS